MERKKRSKGRGWESCYVKKIYGTFGVEMRAYGQKLVQFCKHTHTHTDTRVSYSSIYILHMTLWSAVEYLTLNRERVGSNHLCYHLKAWAFSLSTQHPSSLSCIHEYSGTPPYGHLTSKVTSPLRSPLLSPKLYSTVQV